MMNIIILTASYIGDDVGIVYALDNTMQSFSVTNERTNEHGDSRSRKVLANGTLLEVRGLHMNFEC